MQQFAIQRIFVREIVRAHGGMVDVRSVSGETVFTVYLPRNTTGLGDAEFGHDL